MKRVKVVVTGAAGQIGYALLPRIANGEMFGPEVEVELHLLEIPPALPALAGVVMELEDCAFPLLKNIIATDDINVAMRDANWVISVGAVPRKAGMERSDLLKINAGIFNVQGKAISDNAADDVRVFVVGNPCNSNALIAMNHAKDVPNERFYAMTMLDEKRARTQLAQKAGVDITAISNMIIWGNHSATQYPDYYHAKINDQLAAAVINDDAWVSETFIPTIQQRGAAIIKARGASSAASAANAIVSGVYNLNHDTPAGESYSMCCHAQGEYGVDEGLIFSFPCRTEQGKVKIITDIEHNAFGQEKLAATLTELRNERDAIKEMGLID